MHAGEGGTVHRESVRARVADHNCDGFSVAHKIHVGLPAVSLHDLSGGTGVVHGVSRHQVLTVWRPGQTQDVGRPTTLEKKKYALIYEGFERMNVNSVS